METRTKHFQDLARKMIAGTCRGFWIPTDERTLCYQALKQLGYRPILVGKRTDSMNGEFVLVNRLTKIT